MKSINKTTLGAALLALSASGLLGSCAADSEFDRQGEGVLRLQMVVNSNLTRAVENEDELRSNCVVYISDPAKGLLHKFKGIQNVPSEIHMKAGHYAAEAWTGDSVGASFDKRFFRGYETFDIENGQTSVVVNCKIANVVASINHSSIDPEVMQDWKVTVSHSRATLEINEANQSEKAYFMMPNADADLTYTVSGTRADGGVFSKTGTIANVKRAHEYVLNFSYTPDDSQVGGAFITITIDDKPVEEVSDIHIYGRPSVSGENFDIDKQIYSEPGAFTQEAIVKTSAFGGLRTLQLSSPDWQEMGLPQETLDLMNLTAAPTQQLNAAGISWDANHNEAKNLTTSFLHLGREFLNSLPRRATEYSLAIQATDLQGKTGEATVRIAVGEEAIVVADPVTALEPSGNLLDIRSTSALLQATLNDPEAGNPALEYREAGTETWQRAEIGTTRSRRAPGVKTQVALKGLKPATRYEYRATADGFQGPLLFFTTESTFAIPNAGMEQWSGFVDKAETMIASADGRCTFWDSGNHGSILTGVNLTNPTSDLMHSGSKAAKLRSQKCTILGIGKFAAGNLFAGSFDGLDGTDGKLTFGRQYDGSHPSKLRLWVSYEPGTVEKGCDKGGLSVGDTDQGQIYVALSTEPIQILTKKSAKLFNPDDACVLAYGEKTFTSSYGGGSLAQVEIPLEYREAAKTNRPLYLVLVCSASKFGDFFGGGEGSTMIVDDFALVYE